MPSTTWRLVVSDTEIVTDEYLQTGEGEYIETGLGDLITIGNVNTPVTWTTVGSNSTSWGTA